MTPQACDTCQHWLPHRSNSDYGMCKQIAGVERTLAGVSKAYVFDPAGTACLHTYKNFECYHYEQRKIKRYDVVRAAQNISRAAHNLPPIDD